MKSSKTSVGKNNRVFSLPCEQTFGLWSESLSCQSRSPKYNQVSPQKEGYEQLHSSWPFYVFLQKEKKKKVTYVIMIITIT